MVESGFLNDQDDALPIGTPGMPLEKPGISKYVRTNWRSPGKSPIERDIFGDMGGHGQRLPQGFRANCEVVLEERVRVRAGHLCLDPDFRWRLSPSDADVTSRPTYTAGSSAS